MSVRVYIDSVRDIGSRCIEPGGFISRSHIIGEESSLVFTGTPSEAVLYLERNVPVGTSVCVRHANGLRSCIAAPSGALNKPSLWDDVANYSEG